jgi:S1-C subfamily serine protease
MRSLATLALSLVLTAAAQSPIATEPTPFLVDMNIIPKVTCGDYMGTGVYVGSGDVATARHVISASKAACTVDGSTSTFAGGAAGKDFVLLHVKNAPPLRALINCQGFIEGHHYLAVGYALDAPRPVEQRLVGSFSASDAPGFRGLIIFRGSVTQGMSGGPIFDEEDGSLVGIINANSEMGITESLGFPLSASPLCAGRKA